MLVQYLQEEQHDANYSKMKYQRKERKRISAKEEIP